MCDKKILIIEDEVKISRFIQLELEHEGYIVEKEKDGRAGLEKALHGNHDLIILDVMLPSLNGMEILRRLRQVSEIPVIMLTAKDDVMDKVMGLDFGADDYLTKPFAIEELLARIRVAFKHKRVQHEKSDVIQIGNLKLDLYKYTVSFNNEPIDLTKKEFDLLKLLMVNNEIVLTRDTILEKVWGYNYAGDTNIVDVYVRYLRIKIDDRYHQKFIHTVRGVGYQLKNG
ncbi:two component transcriptional regulator, winged helix family [Desulfofarcimen acetoxidans DSM 771]|jgi:DNA-binding response OmpR family regulator|uniref:Stage 0 sporulation protein A homolog n=1 Tax=Desulfofarcimen acetoxidans (strain ATCC 49208 / DSM 771 / KCTC 5769 / VKM B-1644 / 5575) TaxID=485916 RepID=C8W3M1_DESAS|nr:response regulator transcription factor [Desulfofarcimen acetoxidans]ACV63807.1 two component transcriptional regulator, winged helix family [Desulfofarcimen acetoxidans DSM 771]